MMHVDRKEKCKALIKAYRDGGGATWSDEAIASFLARRLEMRAKESKKNARMLREFANLKNG